MSHRLKIKDEDIRSELKKVKVEESIPEEKGIAAIKEKKTRREMLEEDLLSLALMDASKASELTDEMLNNLSAEVKEIFLRIKKNEALGSSDLLNYLLINSELLKDIEDFDAEKEWGKCLSGFEGLIKKGERDRLTQEIKSKEKDGAFGEVKELLLKFNKLIKNNEENNKKEGSKEGETEKASQESCEKESSKESPREEEDSSKESQETTKEDN
jgi:hypothetical protein